VDQENNAHCLQTYYKILQDLLRKAGSPKSLLFCFIKVPNQKSAPFRKRLESPDTRRKPGATAA
jgi:hypothetical protein